MSQHPDRRVPDEVEIMAGRAREEREPPPAADVTAEPTPLDEADAAPLTDPTETKGG
jgi:hypothetical protein